MQTDCPSCGKEFSNNFNLKRHLENKHGVDHGINDSQFKGDDDDTNDHESSKSNSGDESMGSENDKDNSENEDEDDEEEEETDEEDSDSDDEDTDEIKNEDDAWREIIDTTLANFNKDDYEIPEDFEKVKDILQGDLFNGILLKMTEITHDYIDAAYYIEDSNVFDRISKKIVSLKKKYPKMPLDKVRERAWTKSQYEIGEILMENNDLIFNAFKEDGEEEDKDEEEEVEQGEIRYDGTIYPDKENVLL
jgi:hypothetical protein